MKAKKSGNRGWIGVDLDGTLAEYHGFIEWHIGDPIPLMVDRVKKWLKEGWDVRIFTARVAIDDVVYRARVIQGVEEWCLKHLGVILPVTNVKDLGMVELWDDRAVGVVANTGRVKGPDDI